MDVLLLAPQLLLHRHLGQTLVAREKLDTRALVCESAAVTNALVSPVCRQRAQAAALVHWGNSGAVKTFVLGEAQLLLPIWWSMWLGCGA